MPDIILTRHAKCRLRQRMKGQSQKEIKEQAVMAMRYGLRTRAPESNCTRYKWCGIVFVIDATHEIPVVITAYWNRKYWLGSSPVRKQRRRWV